MRREPTFFSRYATWIIVLVCFFVPFAVRGAKSAVGRMKNDVKDWLPTTFAETHEMDWFWSHFVGERCVVVSWDGCTGEPDDQRTRLFLRKLLPEVPPSRRGSEDQDGAPDSEAASVASDSPFAEFADRIKPGSFHLKLERDYDFIGDRLALVAAEDKPTDWGGRKEKWLRGRDSRWFFITPQGDLHEWHARTPIDGFIAWWRRLRGLPVQGELITSFSGEDAVWYYDSPRRLNCQLFRTVMTGPLVVDQLAQAGGVLEGDDETARQRLRGWMFGRDQRQTCLVVTFTDAARANIHRAIGNGVMSRPLGQLQRIALESGVTRDELKIGGPPMENVAIDESGSSTLMKLVSLSALLGFVLAYSCFRSVSATLIVFFVAATSALGSVAMIFWTGGTTDAIMMSMPALVYVLTISGTVHIMNYYRDAIEDHGIVGAPETAVAHGWKPTLLCNATTAIGLASLYTSEIAPIRKFGSYSALGVIGTLLLLFSLLPAALQIWPQRPRPVRQRNREPWYAKYLDRFWERFGRLIMRHYAVVAVVCLAIVVGVGYRVRDIRTTVNLLNLFSDDSRIRRDYTFLENRLGKLMPAELVLRVADSRLRPTAAQRGDEPPGPDEVFQLSFLERLEIVDRIQAVLDEEFGDGGQGVLGTTMSAVTFAPPLPPKSGGTLAFARRGGTNARLETRRDELLASDYLREDEDGAELWRIGVRIGALQDLDASYFITDLKCAVEPVLAAENLREQVVRAIAERRGTEDLVGARVALLSAPRAAVKASAGEAWRAIDQTRIFGESLRETLTAARFRVDWFDPETNPFPASTQASTSEPVAYDAVVLIADAPGYDIAALQKQAAVVLDARDHTFDPTRPRPPAPGRSSAALFAGRPAVSAVYTGVLPIVYKAQRTLLDNLIESTFWSLITITPLMMFIARGVLGGAVAMIPNVLPVLIIFGAMSWLNIEIDIGSMMSSSIALGVAVDDTIHYLTWFRWELDRSRDRRKAILEAYRRCATPTLQAAVISGIGLSIFALSSFTPTRRFGLLMLSILWLGVIAELVLFPALLASPLGRVFRPSGVRPHDAPRELVPEEAVASG